MFIGNQAELQMIKTIRAELPLNQSVYRCKVLDYSQEEEYFELLLKKAELPSLSLDAFYECRIFTPEGTTACTGRIRERYQNEKGNVLILRVENGFYVQPS